METPEVHKALVVDQALIDRLATPGLYAPEERFRLYALVVADLRPTTSASVDDRLVANLARPGFYVMESRLKLYALVVRLLWALRQA
jgi:hypothetical protein